MTDPRRRSPLEDRAPITNEEASLRLEEVRFAGKLILRGAYETVKPGVATVLGTGLPKTSPNSAVQVASASSCRSTGTVHMSTRARTVLT